MIYFKKIKNKKIIALKLFLCPRFFNNKCENKKKEKRKIFCAKKIRFKNVKNNNIIIFELNI